MENREIRCEVLEIEGAYNVRDVGGYQGRNGREINKRRFLRAGGLHGLTPQGKKALQALGVDCILDLRSTFEARQNPDALPDDGQIAHIHIPMLDYIHSELQSGKAVFPSSMEEMYVGLLANSAETYLRIFKVLADVSYRTVLFHCTAGKDRTGLVAMLLLGLAGASREDLVADYTPSERLFDQQPIPPELPAYLFASAPETIEAAMDYLDAQYGGICAYLRHIGVDAQMEQALLDKLLGSAL